MKNIQNRGGYGVVIHDKTTNDKDLKFDNEKPVMGSDISKLPDPTINGTKY